ncbi:MAG: hypothetical protein JG759_207 [Thermoanaerobacter sp.]|jgi:hypothetical protein|nr:hypothetical protein [Thermoanaerobacter sp.]
MKYLSVVFIILIFLILLYFLPLKIKIKANKEEKNISLEIVTNIFFVNFLTFKLQKEPEKEELYFKVLGVKILKSTGAKKLERTKKEGKFSALDIEYNDFFKIIELLRDVLKDTVVYKFYLNVKIGLEDAAWTAILSGSLWGVIYTALMPIYNNATFTTAPELYITPCYGQNKLEGNLICIFKITCGNIIINGIKFLEFLGSLKGR